MVTCEVCGRQVPAGGVSEHDCWWCGWPPNLSRGERAKLYASVGMEDPGDVDDGSGEVGPHDLAEHCATLEDERIFPKDFKRLVEPEVSDDLLEPLAPGEVSEDDEPYGDSARCVMCGGPVVELGRLGRRLHGRCRDCGADQSVVISQRMVATIEARTREWRAACADEAPAAYRVREVRPADDMGEAHPMWRAPRIYPLD